MTCSMSACAVRPSASARAQRVQVGQGRGAPAAGRTRRHQIHFTMAWAHVLVHVVDAELVAPDLVLDAGLQLAGTDADQVAHIHQQARRGDDVVLQRVLAPGVVEEALEHQRHRADLERQRPGQRHLLAGVDAGGLVVADVPVDLEELELGQVQVHRQAVQPGLLDRRLGDFERGGEQHVLDDAPGQLLVEEHLADRQPRRDFRVEAAVGLGGGAEGIALAVRVGDVDEDEVVAVLPGVEVLDGDDAGLVGVAEAAVGSKSA